MGTRSMSSSPAACCRRAPAARPRYAVSGATTATLRRRVPVLTVVVDTPARIRRWFGIVDELTDETGLVTCEMVPTFRARSHRGDLRLSTLPAGEGA